MAPVGSGTGRRALAVILFTLSCCYGFNLDTAKPSVYSGPQGSYFGFAVDFFTPLPTKMNILIGAPKANTSQPDIVEGGAVYKCPWINGLSSCEQFQFDTTGNRVKSQDDLLEFKSYQWFGASVRTHGDKILACAPRYHWRTLGTQEREPVGTCFLADGEKIVEYAPCRSGRTRADGQGFCQGGFSIDFTTTGRVVLGGPGSFYWQGQLISDEVQEIVTMYNSSELVTKFPHQVATRNAEAVYDDSYLGYSVAVGNFTQDSVEDFVTGIPRGAKSLGYVTILNGLNMASVYNFTGEQMAAYFGYSVAVTDLNNDGRDDLLVGAPLFMVRGSDGKYREVGQVYVYLQDASFSFTNALKLTGTETYARFGSSIAPLGDLDRDGYNDIAIGVPYAGEDHKGLVYIYNGNLSGLNPQPSQTLKGQWASNKMPASFGYAMQGGVDIDANGYPDLIVGAFGVDKAVVYRARPVIHVNASLRVNPSILNAENKSCTLRENVMVSCFTVTYCLSAFGIRVTDYVDFNVELHLDRQKQKGAIKRAMFLHSSLSSYEKKMQVENSRRKVCEELKAFLRDESEFRDKLAPIDIYMEYSLDLKTATERTGLQPILNKFTPNNITEKVRILLDCGDDNICKPDLKLSVQGDRKQLYIGDENPLTLNINAQNEGEGAYEAGLYIVLPPQADYVGVVRNNKSLTRLSCAYMAENETRTVVCDLGNPMKAGTNLWAGLRFSVRELQEAEAAVTFDLQIRSSNKHNATSEVVSYTVDITVLAQVDIRGVSSPDQLFLPIANWKANPESEEEVGPLVIHVYEIRNNGPSAFSKAILDLQWPYRYKEAYLLYIMDYTPEGPMNCTSDTIINPLKLKTAGSTTNQTSSTKSPKNLHHIKRREITESEGIEVLGCDKAECLKINCQIGKLERGKSVVLHIRSRLWGETFMKKENQSYSLMASASYSVIEMPYKNFSAELPNGSIVVTTLVTWDKVITPHPVPVWVIILALLAGLLLLALLVFIMYKIGFFKRVRPPRKDSIERQQLQPQEMNGDGATET
ncbi:integrin alpha-V [Carcharodon carcharias]|uniref:integrin alpha-V n=1 Tax=Carcharodon carcharias TaxID=13397 RepID=UPI001B7F6B56|nr:integrin alpha-V [Carcharodon carcharias]